MVDKKLLNYITSQRKENVHNDAIAQALVDAGWKKKDIKDGFAQLDTSSVTSLPTVTGFLPDAGDILSESFERYKIIFKALLTVSLITEGGLFVVGMAMDWYLNSNSHNVAMGRVVNSVTYSVIPLLIGLFLAILRSWGVLTMLTIIVDQVEDIDPLEAFRKSSSKVLSYIGLLIAVGCVLLGATTLFIVPGIIVAGWLVFTTYVFVKENTGIIEALQRSREYVRGYWWAIAGRLLVLFLITIGASIAFGSVLGGMRLLLPTYSTVVGEATGAVVSALVYPFTLMYLYILYSHMTELKKDIVTQSMTKKLLYIFGAIGLVVPIAVVWFVITMVTRLYSSFSIM